MTEGKEEDEVVQVRRSDLNAVNAELSELRKLRAQHERLDERKAAAIEESASARKLMEEARATMAAAAQEKSGKARLQAQVDDLKKRLEEKPTRSATVQSIMRGNLEATPQEMLSLFSIGAVFGEFELQPKKERALLQIIRCIQLTRRQERRNEAQRLYMQAKRAEAKNAG